MQPTLKQGERIDDLQFKNMRIIQREDAFRFCTDTVLLADFASTKVATHCVDFGTGSGIIPILMAARNPKTKFDALEIQPDMAEMAVRSVLLNKLEDRITVHHCDLRQSVALLGTEKIDQIVCNPPYGREGTALVSESITQRLARHEGGCTLEDIMLVASQLLKYGGRLTMIYPAPRMLELMQTMLVRGLQPKRICMVHSKKTKPPKLILIEAMKGAKPMLHFMPPLIIQDDQDKPTDEYKRIYHIEG